MVESAVIEKKTPKKELKVHSSEATLKGVIHSVEF